MLDPLHLDTSILDTLKNLLKYSNEKLKNTFSFQLQLSFAVAATIRRDEKIFVAQVFGKHFSCGLAGQLTSSHSQRGQFELAPSPIRYTHDTPHAAIGMPKMTTHHKIYVFRHRGRECASHQLANFSRLVYFCCHIFRTKGSKK